MGGNNYSFFQIKCVALSNAQKLVIFASVNSQLLIIPPSDKVINVLFRKCVARPQAASDGALRRMDEIYSANK